MNYVGIDYHKKYSHVTAVDESGSIIRSCRVANTGEAFENFFVSLSGESETVIEASRTWGVIYDLVDGMKKVKSTTLAHPLKVRAIADAAIKTDDIDAEILAQLLRCDLIPAAYIPGKDTRSLKEMIRQRIFLVRMRTRVKNRLHVLLDRLKVSRPPFSDAFGKQGIAYLKKLELDGVDKEILKENLELLTTLSDTIKEAEKEIRNLLSDDERVQFVRSIPGFGEILSAVCALEIDKIERFAHPSKLACYAGLVPTTYASGGKTYHGKLIRSSNKWLRWAFVEAAWSAIISSPYCRSYYDKRKYRRGSNVAIVALARHLSEIVWHVMKEKRNYKEKSCIDKKRHNRKKSAPVALTKN